MTPQPLSRTARLVFLAVVLAPIGFAQAALHGGREMTVQAELRVLDDGRTVRSSFTTNTCGRPLRLDVDEGSDVVRVRTVVLQQRDVLSGCEDVARPRTREVVLHAPLAGRTLVVVEPRSSSG